MIAFYFMYWMNGYWGKLIDLPASGELYRSATAMALAAVVTTQIGNLFAQRTETISSFKISFFRNRLLWLGIASEIAVILLIVYTPLMHTFIGTNSFPLSYWLLLFGFSPLLLIADEIRKWIARKIEGRSKRTDISHNTIGGKA